MKVTTDACLFGAWVADEVKSQKLKIKSLLDIGTGTGLLSLMLAQKNREIKIDGIEIDKETADQAKENVNASVWNDRINIIETDARSFSPKNKYDLIISNPPFYENELKSGSEKKNTAHHSSSLTLQELLSIIKEYLNDDGYFFLLLPYKRNEEIKNLFKDHQLHISKIVFVRQSTKHDFFRIMLKGKINGQQVDETEIEEFSIWDEKQNYTPEFVDLLKDYYLHL